MPGGKNGQDSIRNGVFELEKHHSPDDIVLIHDAIRPMVSAEIISDCIRVTQLHGNAITVIPCAEAMMQTEDGVVSTGSYPRDNLKRTQTPQGFPIGKICDLHRRALKAGITNSVASCTLMIEMGEQVYFSAGSEKNIKLTTVEDIDIFKAASIAKKIRLAKVKEKEMNLHQSKLYFEDIDRALDHVVGMEALRNKSILVTGATGTIGSFVADALIRYSQKNNADTVIYLGGEMLKN